MSHLEKVINSLENGCAVLVSSEINQRWISNFEYTDGFILAGKNCSVLFTDFRYIEAARNEADRGFEIVMPEGSMLEEMKKTLAQRGIKRLLVEDATLSVAMFERFKSVFTDCELERGASKLLDGIRRYKDEGEIEKMKAAQAITDAAFEHILTYINPDRTEVDVALELEFFMRSKGAESVAFQTIAVSGSASSMPHGVPRPVKLEKGFLTMDFGARYQGYCSDMTRTVVIGHADEEIKKLYNTVLEAQLASLEALFNGERNCRQLDTIARNIIDNAGYKGTFGHSLGHGVGMYIHEAPGLSQKAPEDAILGVGDVVTFEPGIYLSGKYGCRIEDMVCITENGPYNFTKSPKHLIEL